MQKRGTRESAHILWTVAENPTRVHHTEIHSPAALNNLDKLSTGLYMQLRETEKDSFVMSHYNLLTYDQ